MKRPPLQHGRGAADLRTRDQPLTRLTRRPPDDA